MANSSARLLRHDEGRVQEGTPPALLLNGF